MKHLISTLFLLSCLFSFSQQQSDNSKPFLETIAKVDTLVAPDRIYLSIIITEQDSKGKISLEEIDSQLETTLTELGINKSEQLFLSDLSSRFKTYFLKEKDIYKSKQYSLIVYTAQSASDVLHALENINISNVTLEKTAYSKMDELKLSLQKLAASKAKFQAQAMLEPFNQEIGEIKFITDLINNNSNSGYLQGRVSGIQVRGMAQPGSSAIYGNRAIPILDVRKIQVEVTVHAQFLIE